MPDLESRISVLESRWNDHILAAAKRDQRLDALEQAVHALALDLGILKTKVALYAAVGAVIGGGIADLAFNLIERFIRP